MERTRENKWKQFQHYYSFMCDGMFSIWGNDSVNIYHNDPKFSERHAWANSVDLDQTAHRGAVWSGSTLFVILSAFFGRIPLW